MISHLIRRFFLRVHAMNKIGAHVSRCIQIHEVDTLFGRKISNKYDRHIAFMPP